jgi:hypothetical protein
MRESGLTIAGFSHALFVAKNQVQLLLHLISEDSRTNVHRGECEVRPPDAPTTGQVVPCPESGGRIFPSVTLSGPNPIGLK